MSVVSIYPHIKEVKKGETIPFSDVMDLIQSDKWKEKIIPIREAVQNNVPDDEISELKSKIPYFTASGTFKVRNDNNLIQHSGKLAIDFDKLEDIDNARAILSRDKHTEYLFSSCSGRGLCVIVKIDPAAHLDSFKYLETYYKDCYNLTADKSCKDVSRPRYISYDPDLIYNPDAIPVDLPVGFDSKSVTIDSDEEKFDWVLNVHNRKHQYVEGQRHDYLLILAYFLNKVGVDFNFTLQSLTSNFSGNGMEEKEIKAIVTHCYKAVQDFGTYPIHKRIKDLPEEYSDKFKKVYSYAHTINNAGRNWTEDDVTSMCKTLYLDPSHVKFIFKSVFENNEDAFDLDNKPEIYKVEYFIKKRYELLKNEVSQRIEFRKPGSSDNLQLMNVDTIYREMQYHHIKFPLDKLKSLLRSNFVKTYNPFIQYFESLPEWDSVDYIEELADFVKTDNQEFWKTQFKKALVRCIACSVGLRENRIVMTLVGESQETGKSSFIRFLCPPELKNYYTETMLDASKDSDMQMSENFIWNMEELAALHNNEINKLKAIISKSAVKQRRAYAEFHESTPRRVNFWASTNKTDFLTDDQNTRWLCFNVLSIDHDYNNFQSNVRKVDINNVWAQAWYMFKAGYNYNLTKEEAQVRDTINKNYEVLSMEKDLIRTYFKPCEKNEGEFMTTTEILILLQSYTEQKIKTLSIHNIGRAMKQLEFSHDIRRMGNERMPRKGYWLIKKSIDLIPSDNEANVFFDPTEPKNKPF